MNRWLLGAGFTLILAGLSWPWLPAGLARSHLAAVVVAAIVTA
jgi:hypothetical protein